MASGVHPKIQALLVGGVDPRAAKFRNSVPYGPILFNIVFILLDDVVQFIADPKLRRFFPQLVQRFWRIEIGVQLRDYPIVAAVKVGWFHEFNEGRDRVDVRGRQNSCRRHLDPVAN